MSLRVWVSLHVSSAWGLGRQVTRHPHASCLPNPESQFSVSLSLCVDPHFHLASLRLRDFLSCFLECGSFGDEFSQLYVPNNTILPSFLKDILSSCLLFLTKKKNHGIHVFVCLYSDFFSLPPFKIFSLSLVNTWWQRSYYSFPHFLCLGFTGFPGSVGFFSTRSGKRLVIDSSNCFPFPH